MQDELSRQDFVFEGNIRLPSWWTTTFVRDPPVYPEHLKIRNADISRTHEKMLDDYSSLHDHTKRVEYETQKPKPRFENVLPNRPPAWFSPTDTRELTSKMSNTMRDVPAGPSRQASIASLRGLDRASPNNNRSSSGGKSVDDRHLMSPNGPLSPPDPKYLASEQELTVQLSISTDAKRSQNLWKQLAISQTVGTFVTAAKFDEKKAS